MFAVLHPLLLWGAAGVAVPVLIHLLLRQRPRPRPWAAMRWLAAAMLQAQRRYRLTNLLLLLLRCLIVLLLALAVARPSLAGLGRGGRLLLVVDTSASMGARGDAAGPLADAVTALTSADLPDRVTILAVADRVRLIADGGADEARAALARLTVQPMPGGLDRAATQTSELLSAASAEADVVLISDFQQDDGARLSELLAPLVRSVRRWAVGQPSANTAIAGIVALPDVLPGQAAELLLIFAGGSAGQVRLALDGGPLAAAGTDRHVALPPAEAGDHRLQIEIVDRGLHYDNLLDLPYPVRGPLPVLLAQEQADYAGAALLADVQCFAPMNPGRTAVPPSQLANEGLPTRGVVLLRGRSGDDQRLARWVADGGVLWTELATLRGEPALAPVIAELTTAEPIAASGPFRSGDATLDEVFALATPVLPIAPATLPASARAVLWAGQLPLVAVLPHGRGRVVVELTKLASDAGFAARGATPLWVRSVARGAVAAIDAPQWWEAGTPAPSAATLHRAGLTVACVAGEPLFAEPGLWRDTEARPIIVLPSTIEARLDRRAPLGTLSSLAEALPQRSGADWGLPLLIAALLVLIGEGTLAAWAGRAYGR